MLTPLNQALPLEFDVHEMISRLTLQLNPILLQRQIKCLLDICRDIFLSESSLVEVTAPVIICGDIHGQFKDLLRIFKVMGLPSEHNRYVFLGDYVDRGCQSTQCMCLLMACKIKNPRSIIILRGNHECASLNKAYGFYNQCSQRYSSKLWKSFVNCFNCMPAAALVSKKILCMHGGLSPSIFELHDINKIQRPCDIDANPILSDLLWADPHSSQKLFGSSSRGAGYLYGEEVVELFCKLNDIELIVRAHQIVQDGYEFCFNQKLLTIFSAPNYCNKFNNDCGILKVCSNLQCSIVRLSPSCKNQTNTKQHPQITQSMHKKQQIEQQVIEKAQSKFLERKRKRIEKEKLQNHIKQILKNRIIKRSFSLPSRNEKNATLNNKKLQIRQIKQRRKSCCIIDIEKAEQQILQVEDDQSVYIKIEDDQMGSFID